MAPGSQPSTAFTMDNLGFYEFTRMPFGMCNAPAIFQRLMQNTLGELNLTYCIIYLNDVIVFGRTEDEHLEHLQVVFEHFGEFNLKLKPSQCNLFQSEIIYFVHHISKEGVHPSKDNMHAISYARNFYAGENIMWIGWPLQMIHQRVHEHSTPVV